MKSFLNFCNKRRIFSLFVALFIVAMASVEVNAQVIISSSFGTSPLPQPSGITATSSGTQNGRLFRSGVASTCTEFEAASTFNVGTTLGYEAYSFYASTTGCLTVDVTALSGTGVYIAVYSGDYNPANYTANCIGQQGSSSVLPFGASVVAGQLYTVVVMQTTPGTTDSYSMTLDNVGSGAAVPVSPWWIIALFILMGTFTVYKYNKRTRLVA